MRWFLPNVSGRDGQLGPAAAGDGFMVRAPPSVTDVLRATVSRVRARPGAGPWTRVGRSARWVRPGSALWWDGPDRTSRTAPWPPAPRREAPGAPHALSLIHISEP